MRFLILVLTFLFLKVTAARAIPETNYEQEYAKHVAPFVKTGQTFRFNGEKGLLLAGIRFEHPQASPVPGQPAPTPNPSIVILPGRGEPYLKYGEVFYDLYTRGYNVYSYDHRGQGLSPHLSSRNAQIGHLDDFLNYVDDLSTFTESQVIPRTHGALYLIAHSLGGGIAARYLIENPNVYHRAVLSAPMLDINTKPYPRPIARAIVASAVKLGLGNRYAIGYGDYQYDTPIEKSIFTHSAARAKMFDEVTRANPETAVGGPSNKWVLESLDESRETSRLMRELKTPTLLLQAGEDYLVNLDAQTNGCARAAHCTLREFPESKHEILMESDSIRDEAFKLILEFLN